MGFDVKYYKLVDEKGALIQLVSSSVEVTRKGFCQISKKEYLNLYYGKFGETPKRGKP